MATIKSQEQFERVRQALKEGEFSDNPDIEREVLDAAEEWKAANAPSTIYGGFPALGRTVSGMMDAANTIGRGAVGSFAGGIGGAMALSDGPEAAQNAYNAITETERFSRQPTTRFGQSLVEDMATVGDKVDTFLTDVGGVAPGGPAAQTALKTGIVGPFELLGVGGARRLMRGASNAPRPPGYSQTGRAGPIVDTQQLVGPPSPPPSSMVPEISELYSLSRESFNRARNLGSGIKPEATQRLFQNVNNLKTDVGLNIDFDPDLHPQATRVRNRIFEDLEAGVDFDKLMTLRELAGEVAGNADKKEAMRGVRMKGAIDNFVDSLDQGDVVGGNPQAAAAELKQARKLWRDASAARTIQQHINLAEIDAGDFTGAGIENKLRVRFRQLARRIEQGYERGFTPDEIAAINRVAQGGGVENLLRFMGKFTINHPLYAGVAGAASYALGGPLATGAVIGGGQLARYLAGKATQANANQALMLPRSGGLLNQ